MNTLEELIYYCKEEKPAGALLLTGEWGCGKTYLIDTKLKDELNESHVFLKISLFGVSSIEDIKKEIKHKWLFAYFNAEEQGEKAKKYLCAVKTLLEKMIKCISEPIKTVAERALSLNVFDFINVESKMGNKKVVLIFDDFERANISTSDLLGCINDYSENQGISTIIVANEDKIKSDDNNIRYSEMKEKIIQRTVFHKPECAFIVNNIIQDMVCRTKSYKEFLEEYVEDITTIFLGTMSDGTALDSLVEKCERRNSQREIDEENKKIDNIRKRRPHNIRSLKCALQDFNRIFNLLENEEIPEKQKWLFSYIAAVISVRAGLINNSERYGFDEHTIKILYPGYYHSENMTSGIMEWIFNGDWNKERILSELDYIKSRDTAIKPEDKVRTNQIFDLEEDDVSVGYPIMLNKAYSGHLELNDYVNILCNRSWARRYKIVIPEVDWNNMRKGVQTKIDSLLQSQKEPEHYYTAIGENDRGDFSKDEWSVYEMIKFYRDGDLQILANNRKLYISLMKEGLAKNLIKIKNKRLNYFDDEMADISLIVFKDLSNSEKRCFIEDFREIWKSNMSYGDYDYGQSNKAMEKFKQGLDDYLKECEKKVLTIARCHTKNLISVIDELIKK